MAANKSAEDRHHEDYMMLLMLLGSEPDPKPRSKDQPDTDRQEQVRLAFEHHFKQDP